MSFITIDFTYNELKVAIQCKTDEYMYQIFSKFANKMNLDLKDVFFLYYGEMVIPEVKLENIIKKKENRIHILVCDIEKIIEITFTYNGQNKIIESEPDEKMINIYEKYAKEIKVDLNNLYFLYNGSMITKEKELKTIINRNQNIINIIVCELDNDEENEIKLIQSKDIICPICNEICLINFNDYRITFSDCKNGQRFTKIMLDEFFDFQKIDESKIICDNCDGEDKTKKSEVNNNLFYKCCTCNINLCPLCKNKHEKNYDKKHLIINYDIKNYLCNEHGERYIFHCKECNKDLCDNCRYDDNHYSSYHKISFLYELAKKKENKMNQLRIKIDDLTKKIPKKTALINKVIGNYEAYYKIANNIINSFEKKNMNFYILNNINNIIEYNDKIIKSIDKIIIEKNVEKKNKYFSEIYQRMIINNEITLKYKLEKDGILRLFGEPFVATNKNNFILIINGENHELSSNIKIRDIKTLKNSKEIIKSQKDDNDEDIIEIKLRQIKTVKDISYMFSGCTKLKRIEFSNWDTNNIVNMACIFNECILLTSISDISKWNTNNVIVMNNMFNKCNKLASLPDISKWKTNNVINMSNMFNDCSSLISLPDISKWNTNNVTNMNFMFNECKSLTSFPDISKWNKIMLLI